MKTAKKMTKAQMRVAVAKDVIAQVKIHNMTGQRGVYLKKRILHRHVGLDLQDVIRDEPKCTVCAIGGAFISTVRLFDEFKVESFHVARNWTIDDSEMRKRLAGIFEFKQLGLIESAFEGHLVGLGVLYTRILDDSARLTVIMRNIVRNKGRFIPTAKDLPKEVTA